MNNCKYCGKEIKTYDKVTIIHKDCFDKIDDLQSQLADKDKEIEYQENMKILAIDNQNKKAIEQLEKVKEKLNDYDIQDILSSSSDPYGEFDENCVTTEKINKIIDQQINELKGEK